MKLRIRDNSVRLRVTRGELDRLAGEGALEAVTGFGGGVSLRYALRADEKLETLAASFADGCLTVAIPARDLSKWASSENVSLSAEQAIDDGAQLRILVEKDFACLTPREGEDDSDAFPHPLAGTDATC